MDFNAEFLKRSQLVEQWLEKRLVNDGSAPELIFEAMRYSVFAGGKRIRPVVLMAAFELFSKDIEKTAPFCCALEMIHTYSLIHDDLPAMDNSDLRRGKAASHIKFGEANAILAGDALLNFAFETMLCTDSNSDYQRILKAARYMAVKSGVYGMIGGQVIDIASENKKIGLDELINLQLKKTGALIAAGAGAGAILGGADGEGVRKVEQFAYCLGLAFQIKDDILDATSSAEALGKPTGLDEANAKNTYVSLMGMEKACEMLEKYTEEAKEILSCFGSRAQFLLMLTDFLLNRVN